MTDGTRVSTCKHGLTPEFCELCAAWNSATYNAERANKAEADLTALRAEVEAMRPLVEAMHTLDREWREVSRDGDSVVVRYPLSVWNATLEQSDAARRLAAGKAAHEALAKGEGT